MGASDHTLTSIEICAGCRGQAIGLHQAGFSHLALVEIDQYAAATLRRNIDRRDGWEFEREYCDVIHKDVNEFEPLSELEKPVAYLGGPLKEGDLDLLAGGVPCPPSRMRESSWVRTMSATCFRACWNSWTSSSRRQS